MNGVKKILVAALVVLLALMFINSLANGVWGVLEFIVSALVIIAIVFLIKNAAFGAKRTVYDVKNAAFNAKDDIISSKHAIEHMIASNENQKRILEELTAFINTYSPYTKIYVSQANPSCVYVKNQSSEYVYDVVQHGFSKPYTVSVYMVLFQKLAVIFDGQISVARDSCRDENLITSITMEPRSLVRAREAQQRKAEQEYRKNAWF